MRPLTFALCLLAAPALADQHDPPTPDPDPANTVKVICGYEIVTEKVPVTVYKVIHRKVPIYKEVPVDPCCEPVSHHCEPVHSDPCGHHYKHHRCFLSRLFHCR